MQKKNYISELIPDTSQLVDNANVILNSLEDMKPINIEGSLVSNNGKYVGREYFAKQVKNSYSYKSKNENDFSGIYVFYVNLVPVYVGISGTIIRRMKYHLFGMKDNESSLVYLIANENYQNKYSIQHSGKRKDFPFDEFRTKIQAEMIKNWSFKYYQIENGYCRHHPRVRTSQQQQFGHQPQMFGF